MAQLLEEQQAQNSQLRSLPGRRRVSALPPPLPLDTLELAPQPLRVEVAKPILKRPKLGRMGDTGLNTHLPHSLVLASAAGTVLTRMWKPLPRRTSTQATTT